MVSVFMSLFPGETCGLGSHAGGILPLLSSPFFLSVLPQTLHMYVPGLFYFNYRSAELPF